MNDAESVTVSSTVGQSGTLPDLEVSIAESDAVAEVAFDSLYSSGSVEEVVSWADIVAVFVVVDERDGKPEGGVNPYIPRIITVEVADRLWMSPRVTSADSDPGSLLADYVRGEPFELVTWGSVQSDQEALRQKVTGAGEPRLEVGSTYVGALFLAADEHGVYPSTVLQLDETGKVIDGEADGLRGATLSEIVENLASAKPVPELVTAAEQDPTIWKLDALQRIDAVWSDDVGESPWDSVPRVDN